MIGRYKTYPEYKSVDSPWFNRLPTHWQSVSLKWISRLYAGGTPSKDNLSFWENGSIPWLNSGAVNQSLIIEPSALITRDAFNNSSAKWIPKESLVMALAGQGKTKGMVAQLGIESTCNQSMAAIVPSKDFPARFLFWWLKSNYQNIRNMAGGDLRDGLNLELLGSVSCPIFDSTEQKKIANFLDHETIKIDTLITKQEKLIELLKEKRQAVISHAVTKGLNTDAPMKDSGVEWLGEVPEHWDKVVFRHFIKTRKGVAFSTSDFCDSGVRVVKASDIKKLSLRKSDIFLPKSFINKHPKAFLKLGDIILSTVGSAAQVKNSAVGQVGMVPQELDSTLLNQNTVVFDSDDNLIHKNFIFFLLQTTAYRDHLDLHAHGTANQASLNVADMLDFRCVIPSIEEQKDIAEYLHDFIQRVTKLEAKATNAIELMKERKTALISAAVTGKIDVRDWVKG